MTTQQARARADAFLSEARDKADRLRAIQPFLIDLSLRENPVGSRVGQTFDEKVAILPLLREFGYENISVGTLDYAMPDELEVDDDFMRHLRDTGADMSGCYAFTAIGLAAPDGTFTPDPSQVKLRDYRVPNTVHEIYLSAFGMDGLYDIPTLKRSLPASVQWLRENIQGENGGPPRIFINIVDGCDAFAEATDATFEVIRILAGLPIEGVTMEDDRGTYMPFQVGAYVAALRAMLPDTMKILMHIHAGAGFENASLIEALLNGADGAWGGLPKRAAVIGHASLGELLANLVRVGNTEVAKRYRIDQLLPLATRLQVLDDAGPVPEDLPILGSNAYRLSLSGFRQRSDRFMDLPPERLGGSYGYRVCPVVSDIEPIRGRLVEVTGRAPDAFDDEVVRTMIRLMRRDLRANVRIDYDTPAQLVALHQRAVALNVSLATDRPDAHEH
jgi:hypothetical protein